MKEKANCAIENANAYPVILDKDHKYPAYIIMLCNKRNTETSSIQTLDEVKMTHLVLESFALQL